MYIYQIAIDNFKSFAEKTVIPFRKGFTTVSGPNGSGKSNIIDSVLFCLGLSTSRTMRAEKLSDLINNLSRRRECFVTITFRKEAHELKAGDADEQLNLKPDLETAVENAINDIGSTTVDSSLSNDEAEVTTEESPIETGMDANASLETDEFVSVARRIKENSSGYTSTYYLNGKTSTLTEIHDYLGRFNISPGCFNVMMQGDVAGFVNMSAVERRKIIDEIAGVAEFDRKIDQAQRELETTGSNIERNTILLGEIELRLQQLAGERDQALKYQKLKDECHVWESKLTAAKYVDLKKSLAAAIQNLADAHKQKDDSAEKMKVFITQLAITREELLAISNEVKRKGEDQQIALKKQIEGLKGHIARKQDAIGFIDEKIAEGHKSIQQMDAKMVEQREAIENINSAIAGFEHQLKELQGHFDKEATAYEKLNQQFDQLTDSSGELNVKRSELRQKLTTEEDALSEMNRQKLDVEAESKRLSFEKDLRTRGNLEASEKEQALSQRQKEVSKVVKDNELEKMAFEAQLKKSQLDYSKLRVSVNTAIGKVNELGRDYARLEAKKRAYDEMNFARPVEMVLDSGIDGVHGTLSQLASVEGDYATALEIAIGGRIQNVVVDDDQVAADAINYLKRNNGGRATFLPLNKIQPARDLPRLPNEHGVVDYAYNLIDFDPRYADIFAYALGDTLVVENMEAARPLLRKYRMVTLDGSLLDKSGAMTGGTAPNSGRGGRFANSQKIESEIETVASQLEKAEIEKEKLDKQLTSLELKLEETKQQYSQCLNVFSRASAELEAVEAQLSEITTSQTRQVDTTDLDTQMENAAAQLQALEKQLLAQTSAVEAARSDLDAIESKLPADEINELRKEMNDVKFQMDHYDAQIRNAQAEIQGKQMERTYQETGIKEYLERIEQTRAGFATLEKEQREHREEIVLTENQIRELEAQTSELDEELKQLQHQRDVVQSRLIDEEKNKNILERQIAQLEEQIVSFQSRKRELEPLVIEVAAELRGLDIDPETINAEELPSEDEVHQNIQRLTKRMQALEPVNMLAIKEYDDVDGRRGELAEKIDTLNRECEAIQVRILGYEELKRSSFKKAFDSVDANFKEIFGELADGQGKLVLGNPDSPFEGGMTIHAQPRGKKMQRIESMSGGEKSLTSLAFVFALQRYTPAPFYALDEVDMNLDGINAEKLAMMIRRESQQGAQFVVVSLRKPMIENSDRTIGVTQRKNGITKVTGVRFRDEVSGENIENVEANENQQDELTAHLTEDDTLIQSGVRKTNETLSRKTKAAKSDKDKKSAKPADNNAPNGAASNGAEEVEESA